MGYGKLFLLGCFVALLGMGTAGTASAKSFHEFLHCALPSKYNPWRDDYFLGMREQEGEKMLSYAVLSIISYESGGKCSSGNEQTDQAKRRELSQYLYVRFGWADVAYYLSLLQGYGDFVVPPAVPYPYGEQEALGVRADLGNGEDLDVEESFRLLREAADKGVVFARLHLAYAYQVGHWGKNGILKLEKDPQQSLALLEQAVSDEKNMKKWSGFGGSKMDWVKFYLAYRYRYGESYGIPANNEKAFMLLSSLIDNPGYLYSMHPYPDAAIELALMHMERCTDDATHQQVFELLEKAQIQAAAMSAEHQQQFLARYQQKMGALSDYLQDDRKEGACH